MKRISIFAIVLLLVVTDISAGHARYRGSWYRRLRWSIHTHGLVPNDLYYSPYAHGYGRSGLVPYWVRYSPYAHGIKHPSGLVNDYACSTGSVYYCPDKAIYRGSCSMDVHLNRAPEDSSHQSTGIKQTRENYLAQIQARKEELRQLAQARKQERALNRNQGKETIVAYLKGNNIDFRMSRLLSIEGKVLSTDFVLDDGQTVISYWDPKEIKALTGQAEHKTLLYRNYVNSWKDFCMEYQQAGGHIFQIVSTDREEILAKLNLCDKLGGTQTTYAVAQTKLQP
ncbi:hypothetical protein ACFL5Z_11260 [Planctomycetota bacterium]